MTRFRLHACAIAALLWLAAASIPAAGTLTIAAAADLQAAFPQLVGLFERESGVKVSVSYGSSGTFFAQIQNGAPFDAYFSADLEYPQRLVTSGHADRDSLYQYAVGHLVLWTRTSTGIDVSRGLAVLRDARVRRIAIANPAVAPYGRAAVAALRSGKLYDVVQTRLVLGDNLSQTAQLADSGNADVAILSLSLAFGPTLRASGIYAEIPASAHPPIDQAAVIVSASRNKDTARQFLAFMKRPEARQVLTTFGFQPSGR
jgi:molybdate transport system substrate-binding protein